MIKLVEQIKIDKRSNYPYSHQIFMCVFNLINTNQLANMTILPSVQEVAENLKIEISEVQTAYDYLLNNSFIKKINDQYIVSYIEIHSDLFSETASIADSIIKSGKTPSNQFIYAKKMKQSLDFYERSQYDKNEPIFEIKRIFFADDVPILIVSTYVSLTRLPDFDKKYDGSKPIYQVYDEDYGISFTDSKRHIKVKAMPQKEAKLLNEIPGTATFQTSYNFIDLNDRLIGYAEIITSSHFAFTFNITI